VVKILDATLREGEQTPGVHFDQHVKLTIATMLDEIGVDFIEAGHPMVLPEIAQTIKMIAHTPHRAAIGAHARSLRKDVDKALECDVSFLGIFFCVSQERLKDVFQKDINYAGDLISDVISYAKAQKPDLIIRYTPEDTVRSNFENVKIASAAAVKAGADIISVADTTGYMVPGTQKNMYDFVSNLKHALVSEKLDPMIAVHCHNDRGLALANALDGFRAGAEIIDTAVLGLGERAGIVDLAQLLVVLSVDFGEKRWKLEKLTELYELVSKRANLPIPPHFPLMGKNAFTHCAGIHTHAAALNPMHYESIDPDILGRERHFALDHMSGITSVRYALRSQGLDNLPDELVNEVLAVIKMIGQRNRMVEPEELPSIVEMLNKKSRSDK